MQLPPGNWCRSDPMAIEVGCFSITKSTVFSRDFPATSRATPSVRGGCDCRDLLSTVMEDLFAVGSGACYNFRQSGEHHEPWLERSTNASTVHWDVLCCHRNRGFTWQGLRLVSKPEEWLIRHGRATGEKHIRASRFIGWMFLVVVGLMLLQLIRSVYAK